MGDHFPKLSEIFAKVKYWRHLQSKMLQKHVSWRKWMKCNCCELKSTRLWHNDQLKICFWGVNSQNSARYPQKSNIDVICNRKCCKDMFHEKVKWNATLNYPNVVHSDMLTNLRSAFGESFSKTQRDICKNQILTSFAIENFAKTCFMIKLNEIQLLTIKI